jgi:hypothetical protein
MIQKIFNVGIIISILFACNKAPVQIPNNNAEELIVKEKINYSFFDSSLVSTNTTTGQSTQTSYPISGSIIETVFYTDSNKMTIGSDQYQKSANLFVKTGTSDLVYFNQDTISMSQFLGGSGFQQRLVKRGKKI